MHNCLELQIRLTKTLLKRGTFQPSLVICNLYKDPNNVVHGGLIKACYILPTLFKSSIVDSLCTDV
jgi:hypothetical protein